MFKENIGLAKYIAYSYYKLNDNFTYEDYEDEEELEVDDDYEEDEEPEEEEVVAAPKKVLEEDDELEILDLDLED